MKGKQFIGFTFTLLLITVACSPMNSKAPTQSTIPESQQNDQQDGYILNSDVDNINDKLDYSDSDQKKIYFAGGCFWGVEAYMGRIYGVSDVTSGYANGTKENPSYQDVIKGDDGFVEAVEITYDPERIDLETLVADLFLVIDPTSKDKQGNDVGEQYRTGIYFQDKKDAAIIQKAVEEQQASYDEEIVTEVEPLDNFYLAEDEHQDYLEKNPNGYCHIDLRVADQLAVKPIEKDEEIVKENSQ